jgi:hypothetical protein
MAGEVPPLNVEILVSLGNLTNAVNEATTGLNKIGDTAKAQTSKFEALKTTMLGVFAGNLMTKGVEILTSSLHEAVKAVEDTQVATEQLATAMNNAKQNTAANREEVTKTSEKMSGLGFAVKDSENAYTKLITATGSTAESTRLMAMAADLARYKHESLAEASATLVKGTMGNARAFKEFGIALDSTLPKNQAIAKAMDELNAKIGGQAVGYTKTFAGQIEVLKAKFDDVAVKVGAVVMPILTKLMEFISNVLVPVITFLYNNTIGAWIKALINLWNSHETLRKIIVGAIEVIVGAFGYLLGAIAKVVDTVARIPILGAPFKAMGKGIDEAALAVGKFGASLDGLANKKIALPNLGSALAGGGTSTGDSAGVTGGLGAAGDVTKGAAAAADRLKKAQDNMVKLQDQQNKILLDRQTKMDVALSDLRTKELDAHTKFDQTKLDIETKYQDAVQAATTTHLDAIEKANEAHQDNIIKINQAAVDKQKAIIQQSIDAMTNGFASVTKFDLAKSFSGTGTTTGLISSMQNQLAQIVQLQKDAGDLAAKGYSQSFINQVIAQGPQVGDQMSQAILNATPQTADQIKSLYAQIDTASNSGLDKLAQTMNDGTTFATSAMAKQYAQVAVDLQKSLADENSKYQDSLTASQISFNKAMTSAGNARDLALQKAQQILTDSLTSAQQAYDKSIKAISDSTMSKLDALMAKMITAAALLAKLGGGTTALPATSYSPMPLLPATTANVGANIGIIDANIASLGKAVGAGVTINAPITVDGSTSPGQIQSHILTLAKFGSGTGSGY